MSILSIQQVKGHCLCGSVNISIESMATSISACHCNMCRRWSGGPLLAVNCGTAVVFDAEEYITVYTSSDWAQRGFCKQCGTHLFYQLKANGQYIMPVGLFDDSDSLEFDHQIFIDVKPEYYAFANKTKNMTEAEIFAQFAGPQD